MKLTQKKVISFFDSFKEYVRVYFAKNKKCLGGVLLSNVLKDGAKELVLNLKKQNLKTFYFKW